MPSPAVARRHRRLNLKKDGTGPMVPVTQVEPGKMGAGIKQGDIR
jgi:hypothetical protein